ncbi:MAG: putative integral rane protein [Microbacteriaceae bacterium]|nr:putative integral rane protein [Microbacteriaceae bacterium]
MAKAYAAMLGLFLGGHALIGLFIEGDHILGLLNVDFFVDVTYLLCAAACLFVGSTDSSPAAVRVVLLGVGSYLVALGLLGQVDKTVWGLLPTGLTMLDFLLLFSTGGLALLLAAARSAAAPLTTEGKAIN